MGDRENEIRSIADYRLALGGVGPLAADWRDKPHRLVYDLCARVEALEAALAAKGEAVATSEPVRRGCWTCSRNYYDEGGGACCSGLSGAICRWLESVTLDSDGMPPRDADGCPGWAAKEGE